MNSNQVIRIWICRWGVTRIFLFPSIYFSAEYQIEYVQCTINRFPGSFQRFNMMLNSFESENPFDCFWRFSFAGYVTCDLEYLFLDLYIKLGNNRKLSYRYS